MNVKSIGIPLALFMVTVLIVAPLIVPSAVANDDELKFEVNGGGIAGLNINPVPGADILLEFNHYKESPFGSFDELVYYVNGTFLGLPTTQYVPVLGLVDNSDAGAAFNATFAPIPFIKVADAALEVSEFNDGHVDATLSSVPFVLGGTISADINFDQVANGAEVSIVVNLPTLQAESEDRGATVTGLVAADVFDPEDIFLPPGAVITVAPPGSVTSLIRIESELEIGG